MIEHLPWIGSGYSEGIDGMRTAIVGFSHWKKPEAVDFNEMTLDVVERVTSDEWSDIRFYSDIMRYFGFSNAREFWSRVLFFNFLPTVVGNEVNKFANGTEQQLRRGAERAVELYSRHQVEKVFVFTNRGWLNHPATEEEKAGCVLKLGDTEFSWGHFETDGWTTIAIGLRHPQGASGKLMKKAVALGRAQG